jgi:GLPGLI family protein
VGSFHAFSQNFTGRVTYMSHKSIDLKLDSTKYDLETRNKLQGFFTKQFQNEYVLDFSATTSLYSEQDKISLNSTSKIGRDKLHKNFETKAYTRKLELLGKVFLIKDSIKSKKWEIKNETKNIGNYTCTKATYNYKKNDSLINVTAWFTKEISVSNGPDTYDGLPGLILQIDDGFYTILSTKVELNTENTIKLPKGGKVVTQNEYDAIYAEKQKEGKSKARAYLQGIESSKN